MTLLDRCNKLYFVHISNVLYFQLSHMQGTIMNSKYIIIMQLFISGGNILGITISRVYEDDDYIRNVLIRSVHV